MRIVVVTKKNCKVNYPIRLIENLATEDTNLYKYKNHSVTFRTTNVDYIFFMGQNIDYSNPSRKLMCLMYKDKILLVFPFITFWFYEKNHYQYLSQFCPRPFPLIYKYMHYKFSELINRDFTLFSLQINRPII